MMTTLITGGTGKSGSSLAKLLHDNNRPLLIASRSGDAPAPFKGVKFDWFNAETFENPFATDPTIDRVYILSPPGRFDAIPLINEFIDFAILKGVKRFVLLSATQVSPEDVPGGAIHKHLIDSGVDYAVLRPSWFIYNFAATYLTSIRDHDQIFSATKNGRLPFISTEDIAQAAFEALTAEKSPNTDIFVLGPELLTYDEAAQLLSSVLGREITHKQYSVEELTDMYVQFGLEPAFAGALAGIDGKVANGSEEALFNSTEVRKFIGKHTLLEFFKENKSLWIK